MAEAALRLMRSLNRAVALVAGSAVLVCAAFIIVEITMRQAGNSLGGTDEISGYVMAAVTTWGLSYALLERAHVRIDLMRGRLALGGRLFLDFVALISLSAVATLVALRAYPVLEKSIANASRANTPLETPLWIPQAFWLAGLAWFAFMAVVLTLIAAALILRGQAGLAEEAIGPPGEPS